MPALARERGLGQGALLALMGIAFAAIVVARLSSAPGGETGGVLAVVGSPGPSATVAPSPTASPARTLVPTAVEPSAPATGQSAAPTLAPTVAPSPSAAPTTYKVRRGDTLSGIAAEFGTTVDVLVELNSIDDPSRLRVGQVLQLP